MNTDLRKRVEELERRVAELEAAFGLDEHEPTNVPEDDDD